MATHVEKLLREVEQAALFAAAVQVAQTAAVGQGRIVNFTGTTPQLMLTNETNGLVYVHIRANLAAGSVLLLGPTEGSVTGTDFAPFRMADDEQRAFPIFPNQRLWGRITVGVAVVPIAEANVYDLFVNMHRTLIPDVER